MRSTLAMVAMLASLVVIWHAVHWGARLVVANFGITGCLFAIGACFIIGLVMDRYGH